MFAISTLFVSTHSKDNDITNETLWEEIIFLIEAFTKDEAYDKCIERCKEEEISYISATNENVVWKFKEILHVSPLEVNTFSDGVEVFSRFLNKKQAKMLRSASSTI
jgi:hypothetical protein